MTIALVRVMPKSELAKHARTAARDAQRSRADSTLRAYEGAWARFDMWCKETGQESMPASPETVSTYLSFLCPEDGPTHKISTMELALVAISQRHELARRPNPRKDPMVSSTRKGIRRRVGVAQRCVHALVTDSIRRIVHGMGNDLADVRDVAILLVGFVGALRRSEIVALRMEDCLIDERGVTITIRRSKTDQEGAGRVVSLPRSKDTLACPARALARWIEESKINKGHVFRRILRKECKRRIGEKLAGGSVALIVQRHVVKAGLMRTDYSGHSLRAGFVTSAAAAGRVREEIKRQTGHKNDQVLDRYIRFATRWERNAADGLL